jgi:hypothetical protein
MFRLRHQMTGLCYRFNNWGFFVNNVQKYDTRLFLGIFRHLRIGLNSLRYQLVSSMFLHAL